MKLTVALKSWLTENMGVAADASDADFQKSCGEAIACGKLAPAQLADLLVEPGAKEASNLVAKVDVLASQMAKLTELMATLSAVDPAELEDEDEGEDHLDGAAAKSAEAPAKKAGTPSKMARLMAAADGDAEKAAAGDSIRMKSATEQYSTTKGQLTYPERSKNNTPHPLAGRPVKLAGEAIDSQSELDTALVGVWSKFELFRTKTGSRMMAYNKLTDHEKGLLHHLLASEKWGGTTNVAVDNGDWADINGRKLAPHEQKAVIDDATSGGLEAAPIVFDAAVIEAPLLYGELFPLVNLINLDRGRRVEGVATGTVTGSWGGIDATAITLFTTTSYVSAFDTTIFRWQGAIQIGLDFASDTPIDFGAHIARQYGERLLEDLDDVIAAGNGTTQPEGIIVKSGTTSVAFGGSTTIGNYESLLSSVNVQELQGAYGQTAVFCGTQTSYYRARAIPVGASDARRLGGMNYKDRTWLEYPYKINSSLTNAQIFFAVLGKYRMYRRRGLTMRMSTEGDTLIRANAQLISVTARFGGSLERGAAAAVSTTAPA